MRRATPRRRKAGGDMVDTVKKECEEIKDRLADFIVYALRRPYLEEAAASSATTGGSSD